MVKEIVKPVYYFIMNIFVIVCNFFIRRDKFILLFGSWYGNRFAGNSRFLFQYLSENKEKYGIKKIIWVSRSKTIVNELIEMGYEAYFMKSFKGIYYHLKSGVHVISVNSCTSNATNSKRCGDIMGELSLGAKHIFLNHGTSSIKGNSILNEDKNSKALNLLISIYKIFHSMYFIRHFLLYPGGWDEMTFFSISKAVTRREQERNIDTDRILYVEVGYPELCSCPKLTSEENSLVKRIHQNKYSIMYLPTYRTNSDTGYIHPLNDEKLIHFLEQNDILWIDKLHPGAKDEMRPNNVHSENVIELNTNFDINVLYKYVSIVITDYSSVYQTAFYFNIPTIFYIPDYVSYCKKDKSLINEYKDDLMGWDSYTVEQLIILINDLLTRRDSEYIKDKYYEKKIIYFDNRISRFEDIAEVLIRNIE